MAHSLPTAISIKVQLNASPDDFDAVDTNNMTNITKQERVNGPWCGSGYYDSCGSGAKYWACGWGCARGSPWTNWACGCCCRVNVVATPSPTPYPTPYPTPSPTPHPPDPSQGCQKWDLTGWYDGTYNTVLQPSASPNGNAWTWEQCAAECAVSATCEFWTLQLASTQECHLMSDIGDYSNSGNHYSGVKMAVCAPTPSPTPYPTPNPTPFPTPYPTPFPTPFPTPYPTPYPTAYPTA